jgi:hypothetical protein
MAIGITAGSTTAELGAPSFVHAFFSTLNAHCEPEGWGTRLPHLMNGLYGGRLAFADAPAALAELRDAKATLAAIAPSQVVWDIEDRAARPPWGTNIAASITSLANYFVSSSGRDVFSVLDEALAASAREQRDAVIA